MGSFGSFVAGAVAGIIGLGVISWAVSTYGDSDTDENREDEEDNSCTH